MFRDKAAPFFASFFFSSLPFCVLLKRSEELIAFFWNSKMRHQRKRGFFTEYPQICITKFKGSEKIPRILRGLKCFKFALRSIIVVK